MTPFANRTFKNRELAGIALSEKLVQLNLQSPVVIALPRGGVPVAFEVCRALRAPLEPLIIRKIGAPFNPEFGIGAVTEGGFFWIDEDIVETLSTTRREIQSVLRAESEEVARRLSVYRPDHALPDLSQHSVIIVDDGLATGVTARVACRYLRKLGAKHMILAVPVCSPDTAESLSVEVDEIVCLKLPKLFASVGRFYDDFSAPSDAEVVNLIDRARAWSVDRNPADQPRTPIAEEIIINAGATGAAGHVKLVGDLHYFPGEVPMHGLILFAHGTHEFYEWRRIISAWLITHYGFDCIAVEGDWPASWELNRFVTGKKGGDAYQALLDFKRWPSWRWAKCRVRLRIVMTPSSTWIKRRRSVRSTANPLGGTVSRFPKPGLISFD